MKKTVEISYFSDVLCVWAYISQIRLDELQSNFGDQISVNYHFMPLFSATHYRIGEGWKDRGGFDGFAKHVHDSCADYPHVQLNPSLWKTHIPHSSAMTHHFLKSVQLLETKQKVSTSPVAQFKGKSQFEELTWRIRLAFFKEGKDISQLDLLLAIAKELALPTQGIVDQMNSGEAMAELFHDISLRDQYQLEGSPTFYLNQGRQKLYGNVGYKIIEANVLELLNKPKYNASWC